MTFEFIEQDRERYGPPAPVPILQEEVEFTPLLDLYRERKPQRVLELGTYTGGTLFHWLQNAPSGALIVSVDDWHGNAEIYSEWCAPGVSYEIVRGDTRDLDVVEFVREYAPFDWAFVDAGHLDEEVRDDWAHYGPMMGPDSVMAFHDILKLKGLPRIQVFHLWAELREKFTHREITSPDGSGIGVLFLP